MADEWRNWLYLGGNAFIAPVATTNGIPTRANEVYVADEDPALLYWKLREGWRTLGVEAFGALYMKWAPKRDAILGKEEHLGKSRSDWERFYLALADERAAREYLAGRAKAAFGSELVGAYMNESERVGKMQQGGRAG